MGDSGRPDRSVMAQLQPAGLLGGILSWLLPKKLEVQVRSEEQPDGTITLTPVCLIGGHEVDPGLVGLASRQHILGYSVVADKKALSVVRQRPANLTKRKAAGYFRKLKHQGISVRNRISETPTDVQEVTLSVTLTLNPPRSGNS